MHVITIGGVLSGKGYALSEIGYHFSLLVFLALETVEDASSDSGC